MDIIPLVEWLGDAQASALAGLIVGIVFGIAAQRSQFCLRAATVEFAGGKLGNRMSIWLLTFSTAVVWTQLAQYTGLFDSSTSRMMAVPGSFSGAIIGGLIFGVGMVLARGCSGRLLVLAATGNLRSVISGLVFAVVALMALQGWLAPIRRTLAALWITPDGHNINLLDLLHLPGGSGMALGFITAVLALYLAYKNRVSMQVLFMASGVGFAVALGWVLTSALAAVSFDPVQIESASFTGPSARTLIFLTSPNPVLDFDIGLIAGVFIGAFLAALIAKELRFQGFESTDNLKRAIVGGALMGMGGMLAGGCAIGAGVTGGSIFAATAWLALFCMWVGAVITSHFLNQKHPTTLPA
jgi:uncharacterized membrane protein YedE/YeeE